MKKRISKKTACMIMAVIMAALGIVNLIGSTGCDWPNPFGLEQAELDLTGYSLVFNDEFDGDKLDTDVWGYWSGPEGSRGYYDLSQIQVKDGNLVMTAEYLENGKFGPAWYSGDLNLLKAYKNGYFEIRCICNNAGGFWSAFWMRTGGCYDHDISKGGPGGAEIDIMEALNYKKSDKTKYNCISSAIHCNGGDDNPDKIDSKSIGSFAGNDIYNTYNTYGLKWTESEYIFYVNGKETARSTFSKGVSQVPETVRVSLCLPTSVTMSKGEKTQFIVDYVRIYQQ